MVEKLVNNNGKCLRPHRNGNACLANNSTISKLIQLHLNTFLFKSGQWDKGAKRNRISMSDILPSVCVSLVIPPMASFALRGTAREFT